MKELTVVFFCSWKFALTFPVAVYGMKMSFIETILYSNLGGLIGVIVFTYLSSQLLNFWNSIIRPKFHSSQSSKPIFTGSRRRFIKIKNNYGLAGIIILNPVILSIPISTFLIIKYYGLRKRYLAWLIAGQLVWSIVYSIFYIYIRKDIL